MTDEKRLMQAGRRHLPGLNDVLTAHLAATISRLERSSVVRVEHIVEALQYMSARPDAQNVEELLPLLAPEGTPLGNRIRRIFFPLHHFPFV